MLLGNSVRVLPPSLFTIFESLEYFGIIFCAEDLCLWIRSDKGLIAMLADQFMMSPSLMFVKQATWIGQDLAQSPSPSLAAFRPTGVYNDNFRTLMPDRETAYWTSDGTLLRPELCNNEIVLDPCQMCLTVPDNTLTWGLLTPTVPRVSAS
ncbi:hypothetical protein Tco_1039753 [Tanacetum coccineum]